MPKIIFCLSLLATYLLGCCQKTVYSIEEHGTELISCITKEGIAVAADSRWSKFKIAPNIPKKIYAWSDGHKKIYTYKGIFVQLAGAYDFRNYTFYGLFKKFQQSNKRPVNIKTFYSVFSSFAKKELSPEDYQELKRNTIIISGYFGSIGCIYRYKNNNIDSAIGKGFIILSLQSKDMGKMDNVLNTLDTAHLATAINFEINFIHWRAQSPSNEISLVGGPISTGYVKPNGEINENFQNNDLYIMTKSKIEAELTGKIKTNFTSKDDSVQYRKALLEEYKIYSKN